MCGKAVKTVMGRHYRKGVEESQFSDDTLLEDEFDSTHLTAIRDTVARLGIANVRAFGLTWEDCEQLLAQLDYSAQLSILSRSSLSPTPASLHPEIHCYDTPRSLSSHWETVSCLGY